MPKLFVNENFQFRGKVQRAGVILTVEEADLMEEIARGNHKKTKRPLSGLLAHCAPADDKTADLLQKVEGAAKKVVLQQDDEPVDNAEELESAREEMDKMSAAYDRRWGLSRMKNEVIKAKKARGL